METYLKLSSIIYYMLRRNKLLFKITNPPKSKPYLHNTNSHDMKQIGTGMSISANVRNIVESIFGKRKDDINTNNSELLNNKKVYERKL